jgi:hypothetical protein
MNVQILFNDGYVEIHKEVSVSHIKHLMLAVKGIRLC